MGTDTSILYISPVDMTFRPTAEQLIDIVTYLDKAGWLRAKFIIRPAVGKTIYAYIKVDGREISVRDLNEFKQNIKKEYGPSKKFVIGIGMMTGTVEKQLDQLFEASSHFNTCEAWGIQIGKFKEIIAISDTESKQVSFSFCFSFDYRRELVIDAIKELRSQVKKVPLISELIDELENIIGERMGVYYSGRYYTEIWAEKNPVEVEKGDFRS